MGSLKNISFFDRDIDKNVERLNIFPFRILPYRLNSNLRAISL